MTIGRRVDKSSNSLSGTRGRLSAEHDLLLVDLDGVVFVGDRAVPGAAEALEAAKAAGVPAVFVTNNASRPPHEVAAQLTRLGVAAGADQVMTSAIAAANALAERVPARSPVLVIGGAGVREALAGAGLRPVASADDHPVAVVQGFAPEVDWSMLAEAAVAIRSGVPWIATNADVTLPSPRGPLPGNGSLVAAVAAATGATPEVIGKPGPALYLAAREQHHGQRPLAVGDRLDTDIAGAVRAGIPSLLVLSGVSGPVDVLNAGPQSRPHYLGRDLGALGVAHPEVAVTGGAARCGPFEARLEATEAVVRTSAAPSSASPDGLDGLRALAVAVWVAADAGNDRPDTQALAETLESLDLNL